jgi:hypothetical protein
MTINVKESAHTHATWTMTNSCLELHERLAAKSSTCGCFRCPFLNLQHEFVWPRLFGSLALHGHGWALSDLKLPAAFELAQMQQLTPAADGFDCWNHAEQC